MKAYTLDEIKNTIVNNQKISGRLRGTSIIFSFKNIKNPLLGLAIHCGTKLPPELQKMCLLSDWEKSRIEDFRTEVFLEGMENHVYTEDSRFLYDLNRSKETCLYEKRGDLWGVNIDESTLNKKERKELHKPIWAEPFSEELKRACLEKHDLFYSMLSFIAEFFLKHNGNGLFFDMHSYNWKARSDPEKLPDVNLGTEFVDLRKHHEIISTWIRELEKIKIQGRNLVVAENALFKGGYLTRFISEAYPDVAVLCSEFKKIYMDEDTNQIYAESLEELRQGINKAVNRLISGCRK
jgi:N-formylglutamate amidohydrolase